MREAPIFRKCCQCVPLRVFLHIWAWFKVVADITISSYFTFKMLTYHFTNQKNSKIMLPYGYLLILIPIDLVVDFAFLVVLIYGVCKKNHRSLKVFSFYGIYMILAEAFIMMILVVPLTKHPLQWNEFVYSILFMISGLLWILLDIFILLTLKSEVIKIRNKEQYNFARMSPNAKSGENNTETIKIDEDLPEKCENFEKKYILD